MITVTMYLSAGEFCKGFTIKGHADSYVGDSQYDLVCAAVSAVTLTCALRLRDLRGKLTLYFPALCLLHEKLHHLGGLVRVGIQAVIPVFRINANR